MNDKKALFSAVGPFASLRLKMLTGFATLFYFLISSFVGALMFLAVQKVNNKLVG